jgi:hypothetical protein
MALLIALSSDMDISLRIEARRKGHLNRLVLTDFSEIISLDGYQQGADHIAKLLVVQLREEFLTGCQRCQTHVGMRFPQVTASCSDTTSSVDIAFLDWTQGIRITWSRDA